ncbi:MAG: DUF5916 domain-containing protein [Gemmatimonadetes bacterium]|nr:DUF5916 domain-containing protein [Gemmatimonadota bacterium]
MRSQTIRFCSAVAIWSAGLATSSTTASAQSARAAQPVRPSLAAAHRSGPVAIDGRLDEAAWADAPVGSDFVQLKPVEGTPAEQRTEVRVLYDDGAVYVAARMFDSDPATIARQLVRRDEEGTADWIGVTFDPRLDRRTAYTFFVSAAGVQRDQYFYNDKEEDSAWNAVWESAVQIDSVGWTAEFRIPLSQLRYETAAGDQMWGVNFARGRFASNEETHFSLISELQQGLVSQYGTLTGIRTERTVRRIELRPYAVAGGQFEPAEPGNPFADGSRGTRRAGIDMRYGLGSSFTLDATINPDFGQVEADPAVINLTAFETFFDEQRPFFVEDARIFDFQLSGGNNRLFYGRRIGRRPSGREPDGSDHVDVPESATILGAAKLTGRTQSGLSIGAIAALTDRAKGRAFFESDGRTATYTAEPQTVHSAVRAKQDFGGGASTLGAIATLQARQLPGDRSFAFLPSEALSAGIDWEHQWKDRTYAFFGYFSGSHIRGDSTAMIRVQRSSAHYLQRVDALRLGVDSSATSLAGVDWRMTLEKRRGTHWTGSVWAAQVTPTFDVNDIGFSSRQEVLDGGFRVQYREITPDDHLRSYRFSLSTFHNWSHDALEDLWSAKSWGDSHVNGSITLGANTTLLNYWELGTNIRLSPERADRSGTRGGPMMIAPRAAQLSLDLTTDERKPLVFEPSVEFERQALGAGSREEFALGVSVRPSSRVQVTIEPKWERSRVGAQYVATSTALPYGPTYGSRYLFAELDRREVAVETRMDITFSPTLTLQMYAEPLLSSGNYLTYKQLKQARSFAFDAFAEGSYSASTGGVGCTGGSTCTDPAGQRYIDFDGNGSSDFSFSDRDFNVRSLIGNAVLRWEYRPGSTLFLVWQRQQEDEARVGDFDFSRDSRALFGAPARNVFLIKASYWVGL